jgi:hypothetical protein
MADREFILVKILLDSASGGSPATVDLASGWWMGLSKSMCAMKGAIGTESARW